MKVLRRRFDALEEEGDQVFEEEEMSERAITEPKNAEQDGLEAIILGNFGENLL